MKRTTVTLSARFHQWRMENPHEILAMTTTQDTKTIVSEMSDDVFDGLLERIRKEGGSLAQWLISSDDFVTDITIATYTPTDAARGETSLHCHEVSPRELTAAT